MRIMGNCLSPVHADFPLTLALQVIGAPGLRISTAQALLQCLAYGALRPVPPGSWSLQMVGSCVRKASSCRLLWQFMTHGYPDNAYHLWASVSADGFSRLRLIRSLSSWPLRLISKWFCGFLGQQLPEECLQSTLSQNFSLEVAESHSLPASPAEACLEVDALPPLPLPLQSVSTAAGQELMVVTGRQGYYFLDRSGPHFLWAISQVMGFEGWQEVCFFETERLVHS